MKRLNLFPIVLVCFLLCGFMGAEDEKKAGEKEKKDELTLEKLFPEKSFFGPSARSMAFSFDGKYAAYLYHPYKERRHGYDLYLLDTATGEVSRITSATVMAEFQKSAREVVEDRVKKAKAEEEKKKKEEEKAKDQDKDKEGSKESGKKEGLEKEGVKGTEKEQGKEKMEGGGEEGGRSGSVNQEKKKEEDREKDEKGTGRDRDDERKKLGDRVGDDDAEDEKAPRYGGISSFEWSPTAEEMLFISEGDLYLFKIGEEKPVRLTCTDESERSADWLPDGSGYVYSQEGTVRKVVFGCHLMQDLDPRLPRNLTLGRFNLSPDGRRMALVASQDRSESEDDQMKVNIANYRDRFMRAREVTRLVSDAPMKPREAAVFLYEFNDAFSEKGRLVEVYKGTLTQPRDFVQEPEWSPDSNRATFAVYDQASGQIRIMEAVFPEKPEKKEDGKRGRGGEAEKKVEQQEEEQEREEERREEIRRERGGRRGGFRGGRSAPEEIENVPAKEVHRFLHTGGPTTPRMIRPYYIADSRRIVFLSEQTGFRHLHVLDPVYESLLPLTHGHFEVYPLELSKDHHWMFVTATKEHPTCTDVYRVSLEDGEMIRLSTERGDYSSPAVSPDGRKLLANYVRYGTLRELVYRGPGIDGQKVLTDSHPPVAKELTKPVPEFFTFKNRHGQEIHGHMFKPEGWKKEDKRPLLIYVYGGPLGTRKQVVEGSYSSASYLFAYYMTQKHGFITCTIDPRGNSGYGGLFEKANYEQVGKPQVEDIVDGVKFMVEHHGVDPKRVAMHGWSFGGFQTQMCLYTEPEVFAAGIAGAGPTEWENYNAWYTSETIGISEPGSADLKKFSLLPLAKNLKAKLLLVHGMEDSNVLYQDTVRVYRELLKAGKETLVELFLDPTGGHGLGGEVKSLNRYRKYEEFLLRTVGSGSASS